MTEEMTSIEEATVVQAIPPTKWSFSDKVAKVSALLEEKVELRPRLVRNASLTLENLVKRHQTLSELIECYEKEIGNKEMCWKLGTHAFIWEDMDTDVEKRILRYDKEVERLIQIKEESENAQKRRMEQIEDERLAILEEIRIESVEVQKFNLEALKESERKIWRIEKRDFHRIENDAKAILKLLEQSPEEFDQIFGYAKG